MPRSSSVRVLMIADSRVKALPFDRLQTRRHGLPDRSELFVARHRPVRQVSHDEQQVDVRVGPRRAPPDRPEDGQRKQALGVAPAAGPVVASASNRSYTASIAALQGGPHGLTLSEWVRQGLRRAARDEPPAGVDRKLATIRAAARHDFPTADIDRMLREIESGYGS